MANLNLLSGGGTKKTATPKVPSKNNPRLNYQTPKTTTILLKTQIKNLVSTMKLKELQEIKK